MNKVLAAFILGIVAGVLNVLFAAAAALGGALPEGATQIAIYILADAVCVVNLAGACICRTRRAAGGAIMLCTALPLLAFVILGITRDAGAAVFRMFPEVLTAVIITELVSVTAAILCFMPAENKQSDFYYEYGSVRPAVSSPPGEDRQLGKLVQDLYGQSADDKLKRPDGGTET